MLRSTAAATLAYVAATRLSENPLPLTASLTALLVVQVTLYATLTASIRRVLSVLTGVLFATWFVDFFGFSWWSLGLLILACQAAGYLMRLQPWVPEVAISGMLVLGVGAAAPSTALGRVIETVIGAVVGVLLNLTVAPPLFVQSASSAIQSVAQRLRDLLRHIGGDLQGGVSLEQTAAWLREAHDIDDDISQVDEALIRAEEGTRLNPRPQALRAPNTAMLLRSGLDTLEHCSVTLRSLCWSLADLSQERGESAWVYGDELAASLSELLGRLGDAADSFGRLITTEIASGAEQAEADLGQALEEASDMRERVAMQLWLETGVDPETWELHGSLLANVDRLLNELDLEKRLQYREELRGSHQGIVQRAQKRLEPPDRPPPGVARHAAFVLLDRVAGAVRSARDRVSARRRPSQES